jgi:hypothetical protein
MEKIETTDSSGSKITYYKCHDNRKLEFTRDEIGTRNGFTRRFNHRSREKNYKEMMFNIMGRNINKYHRFNQGTLEKFEPETA